MNKVRVITRSVRSFRYALVSLLPFIGLPFAVLALWLHWQARREAGKEWNPAGLYLKSADAIASVGALISIVLIVFVLLKLHADS